MQKPTRADRFRELRAEIMKRMEPCAGQTMELQCGPCLILFRSPESGDFYTWSNLKIYPGGKALLPGHTMLEKEVVDVDWNWRDRLTMKRYRSGPWEEDLLARLKAGELVVLEEGRNIA